MTRPSVKRRFVSVILIVSPAVASMVGPGNVPLVAITTLSMQSGDQCLYSTSHFSWITRATDNCTRKINQKHEKMIGTTLVLELRGSSKNPMLNSHLFIGN